MDTNAHICTYARTRARAHTHTHTTRARARAYEQTRYTYDPATRRTTEFYANAAFCRLLGLAPEALCAMVAAKDVPAVFSEVLALASARVRIRVRARAHGGVCGSACVCVRAGVSGV